DVERHVVSVRGEELSMPLKEFELLEILVRNSGRVMTRGQLIDRIWGEDYVGDTKTLDVHAKRLRAKVEANRSQPRLLTTVRGLGSKLEASSEAHSKARPRVGSESGRPGNGAECGRSRSHDVSGSFRAPGVLESRISRWPRRSPRWRPRRWRSRPRWGRSTATRRARTARSRAGSP